MKKKSIVDLGIPVRDNNTLYYIWRGHHQALLELVHTPEVKERLRRVLGTRKRARVWCPLDGDRIVTLVMKNEGFIVSS